MVIGAPLGAIAAAGVWPGGGGGGADDPQPMAAMAARLAAQFRRVPEVFLLMIMRRFLNEVFQNAKASRIAPTQLYQLRLDQVARLRFFTAEFTNLRNDGVSIGLWQAVVWQSTGRCRAAKSPGDNDCVSHTVTFWPARIGLRYLFSAPS